MQKKREKYTEKETKREKHRKRDKKTQNAEKREAENGLFEQHMAMLK